MNASSEPVPTPGFERIGRLQLFLWIVALYLLYGAACFALESYARHRFSVRRQSEIGAIQERRARLLAETARATGLAEMEEWLPYRAMMLGSVIMACAAGLTVGFLVMRALLRGRRRTGRSAPIRFWALGVFLAAGGTLLLVLLPPDLAGILWETQDWLLWPVS